MAGTRRRTNSKDVGNATGSSSKAQRARGVSGVRAVNPKINQDDFFADLDSLIGVGREQGGCSVGVLVSRLEEPLKSKLISIMKNESVNSAKLGELMLSYGLPLSSTDVLRRHRRRLIGKDGCKCPRES
jgi:hypothetical protein